MLELKKKCLSSNSLAKNKEEHTYNHTVTRSSSIFSLQNIATNTKKKSNKADIFEHGKSHSSIPVKRHNEKACLNTSTSLFLNGNLFLRFTLN
jgi:hypothetical protein